MAEFVSVHSSGGLATIRLDRPPVNALLGLESFLASGPGKATFAGT